MEIHKPVVLNGTYVRSGEHHCHFPNALQRVWSSKSLRAYRAESGDKFTCAGCGRNYRYNGAFSRWELTGYAR